VGSRIGTLPPVEGSQPPGWYPDPWGPGGQRWWDGNAWTAHVAPAVQVAPSTDGFAIASLVLGVIGGSLLAIIFGFVARGRIKRSGGAKQGSGLATAGIVLGFVWVGAIALLIALGATGVLDSENRDDFSGQKRDVAAVVDRFEQLSDDEEADTICNELLTPEFSELVSRGAGKSCQQVFLDEVGGEVQAQIDVHSIDITGDRATVKVDEGGDDETWSMVLVDGAWRIDSID
jgi:hypothetical protein